MGQWSRRKKVGVVLAVVLLIGGLGAIYANWQIAQDKELIGEWLDNEELVIIIERYDMANYKMDEPVVYGADKEYFHEAFSASKIRENDNFSLLSEQDKEQIVGYLSGVQYRWRVNEEKASPGMSRVADTYFLYLTAFQEDGELVGWANYVISEDMRVSRISAPQIGRYIGVNADFLADLQGLFAENVMSADENM